MRICPYRGVTTIDEKMTIGKVTIGEQVNIDEDVFIERGDHHR